MCTKLSERVLEAAELILEHKDVAFSDLGKKRQKVEEYLWQVLNRIGINNTELGFKFIETGLVTLESFNAESLKPVWRKVVWDILCHGSIQWPVQLRRGRPAGG